MSDNRYELIAALNSSLIGQRYSPVVARNYCTYASGFLDYLGQRDIPVADVSEAQVRRLFTQTVGIFILPPSLAELERRLRARGQDDDATIQRRMAVARSEIEHAGEFDYVIINKDFGDAKADLAAVVRAARLRTERQRARHPAWFVNAADSASPIPPAPSASGAAHPHSKVD